MEDFPDKYEQHYPTPTEEALWRAEGHTALGAFQHQEGEVGRFLDEERARDEAREERNRKDYRELPSENTD